MNNQQNASPSSSASSSRPVRGNVAVNDSISYDDSAAPATDSSVISPPPPPPPLGYQLDVSILDDYLHSLLVSKFISSVDPLLIQEDTTTAATRKRTLRVLLSSIIPAITFWFTQAQTPATKALGLQTIIDFPPSSTTTTYDDAKSIVWKTKWKYIIMTSILPLLFHALQRLVLSLQQQQQQQQNHRHTTHYHYEQQQEQQEEQQEEELLQEEQRRRIAKQRQYTIARGLLRLIEQGIPLCKLGLLLSLLWKKKKSSSSSSTDTITTTPRLAMVLAGLRHQLSTTTTSTNASTTSINPSTATNHHPPLLYVLYAHRRWLYEESLQTFKILFTPLLVSLQQWRTQFIESRFIERMVYSLLSTSRYCWRSFLPSFYNNNCSGDVNSSDADKAADSPCALCGKHPILIPYETDSTCQHVFCYTCIWRSVSNYDENHRASRRRGRRQQQPAAITTESTTKKGTGYPCPICRRLIRSSRPVPFHQ